MADLVGAPTFSPTSRSIPDFVHDKNSDKLASDGEMSKDIKVIILEIQSRAMKAKPRPKEYLFAESLWWVVSATTGKSLTSTKEEWEEEDACDDGTETFYSVKSCLSQCSSEGGSELKELRRRSVWDEFRHYEGWPFGLCRRAVMLPPLPSSPSDSWTWRKRTHAAKTCAIN